MKKVLLFFLVFMFAFASCNQQIIYEEGTATIGADSAVVSGSDVESFNAETGSLVLNKNYSNSKYLIINDGKNIPCGRLVEVLSSNGNSYVVKDTQFANAVKDANLSTSIILSKDKVERATPLTRGVYLNKSFDINVGKNLLEYADKADADFKVSDYLATTIAGKITIAPVVEIDMNIKDFKLQNFKVALSANIDAQLALELSAKYNFNKYIPLYKFNYSVITIMAGPVPIVIQPIVEVGLDLSFGAQATAKISFSEHIDFSVYAINEGGSEWKKDAKFNAERPKFENFAATVNINGKIAFKEKVGLMLYGLIGANLDARQFLAADYSGEMVIKTLEEFQTAEFKQNLSAEFGLGFAVNIRVSAFSFVDKDFQIVGKDFTLARFDWDCKPGSPVKWSGLIPDAVNNNN